MVLASRRRGVWSWLLLTPLLDASSRLSAPTCRQGPRTHDHVFVAIDIILDDVRDGVSGADSDLNPATRCIGRAQILSMPRYRLSRIALCEEGAFEIGD